MNLNEYKDLIESKLDIKDTLLVDGSKIVPNKAKLTKKAIKDLMIDDLFEYHMGKLVFKNRLMSFVAEITDRKVLTGHYFFELR